MKNLSTKIAVLLTFCVFTVAQVSAAQTISTGVEQNECLFSKSTEAYSKTLCIKSWLSSLFNKRDYVVEDSLLASYMYGKTDSSQQVSDETSEKLISKYLFGENSDSIAYTYNPENMSYAMDLEDSEDEILNKY